jgi:anthranilate/para-aminobenzoate synthase component I
MSRHSRSLHILHTIIENLSLLEMETDVFVQGTLSNLTVAIGQTKRLIIQAPKQDNWAKIKNFILTHSSSRNYVVGYLGHGLHRTADDASIRNSYHPDAYLVVPDTVIRIIEGTIAEVTGDFSKYGDLDFTKAPVEEKVVAEYPHSDTDLVATDYIQKVANIQEWIKERNQDDRITLSRQVLLDTDFSIIDRIVHCNEGKLSNPYNRVVYHKFLDEAGSLVEYGGVSPELLGDGSGLRIRTNKLSGTYAKTAPTAKQELWSNKKILDEHRGSISALVKRLNELSDDVTVEGPIIFELPTLLHLLSIINTRVQDKHQLLDVIQALVLTGATSGREGYQKLYEMEGVSRGAYYGLSVLFGPDLEFYSCPQIIRCVFRYNDFVWTQVGGQISRLSNSEDEFCETVSKVESILTGKKAKE